MAEIRDLFHTRCIECGKHDTNTEGWVYAPDGSFGLVCPTCSGR